MKNSIFIAALSVFSFSGIHAQENQIQDSGKKLYVKGNAVFIPIGIVNVGLEHQITDKITIQGDVFISPWKSFAGHELQYYSASVEGRYYFKNAFEGWFLGVNMGASKFVLQKWNYWNNDPYPSKNEENVVFTKSNLYQKGYSFLAGITAGYQFRLSENWRMEVYGTIGTSQDAYKGYDRASGKRYDEKPDGYNRSGEIIPYRGGLMISYRLK